jgi:hypothetical protein
MKRALSRLHEDERGAVVVIVGALLALLLVFCVYAIDASQMMLVRTQLQNAADAGALAGAQLLCGSATTADATDAAILACGANDALIRSGSANVMGPVVITASDVTFDSVGLIHVTTHRTQATDDQFMNYFLRIFKDDGELGEMTAHAAAGCFPVCGSKCIKPWGVPDQWCDSVGTGTCEGRGNGVYEPELGEFYDPAGTGYAEADVGDVITIVPYQGQGSQLASLRPEYYYAIQFPAIGKESQYNPANSGLPEYLSWIEGCVSDDVTIEPGDLVPVQTGASPGTGNPQSRVQDIIDSDPDATWDASTQSVINSAYEESPRIIKLALIDPSYGVGSNPKHVKVVKIGVIFLANINNAGNITGRFMRVADPEGIICQNPNDPTFLYKATLVE